MLILFSLCHSHSSKRTMFGQASVTFRSTLGETNVPLWGREARELIAPIPMSDVQTAMRDSLPELLDNLKGDERNVLLTLARMWVTTVTGEFLPKEKAAKRVIPRLTHERAALLDTAAKAYLGECVDDWSELEAETQSLAAYLREKIEEGFDSVSRDA
jgi:streptomycin 3"-adenylyltransferase